MQSMKFLLWRTAAVLVAFSVGSLSAFGRSAFLEGVGNFHKVDDHVYRGAQPTTEGFRNLAKLGIRIIVDLREPGDRSSNEERTVAADGMQYVPVPMNGMHAPPTAAITRVLNLLESASTGPVFVHCKRGADRTGSVIACYRVEHDHWANDKALAEARSLGMSWMEKGLQHFILNFMPRLDDTPTPSATPAAVETLH
jgi:tyrosine-protein phosphatase SIW14